MGTTSYRNVGFRDAISYALNGNTVLASGVGLTDDMNATWYALDGPLSQFICLARWRTYGRGPDRETAIKLITDDMGPHDVCVPDNVWAAITPNPAYLSDITRDWRARVASFRRRYPLRVRDLTAAHRGRMLAIPSIPSIPSPVRYLGTRPNGRHSCHVFDVPGHGARRLPRNEERVQRCSLVAPAEASRP